MTEKQIKKSVPQWAREVPCPKCSQFMTPLRAKQDKQYGESIQYQCHNMDAKNNLCLVVISVTTSVRNFMRPGDFSNSQFDWRTVAPQTISADEVEVPKKPKSIFLLPKNPPPSPWVRETATKIIWDTFWHDILSKEEVAVDFLKIVVFEKKGKSPKIDNLVETVPEWITAHSGYAIVRKGNVYVVTGKTFGNEKLFPYSDPSYRKAHGL